MLRECIDSLNIKPDGIYVDATCGGGGHSYEIAARLGEGGFCLGCSVCTFPKCSFGK